MHCKQLYTSSFNLNRHIAQIHLDTDTNRRRRRLPLGLLLFSCKVCDQRFPRRVDLRRHFLNAHAGEGADHQVTDVFEIADGSIHDDNTFITGNYNTVVLYSYDEHS